MSVHGANIFLSDLVSGNTAGNACVFYFLHILIDTTLGEQEAAIRVAGETDVCVVTQVSHVYMSFFGHSHTYLLKKCSFKDLNRESTEIHHLSSIGHAKQLSMSYR